MIIAWMLYSALVALVVAAAARAAEWLARLAGYRVRWIWAGALALTLFLSASAALRGPGALSTAASSALDVSDAAHGPADTWWGRALSVRLETLRRSLDAPLVDAVTAVRRTVSPAANRSAVLLSSAISVGLLCVLVGVERRLRSARREWPLVTMQGVGVRVAPCIGPVVIGFLRPEIVVPRWLFTRHADDQRLVVTHEGEHVRARDPLLLGFAWSVVVVMSWNPAVWYMLSRLRLAIELDCDARVLRGGAAPRSYGTLLIDVAQQASALRLSALALADDSSHLYQRILAMKPSVPRFARLRGGLAAAFALAGVLVACEATPPGIAGQLDTAPLSPSSANKGKAASAPIIFIDGVRATVSRMDSLDRTQIQSVDVLKGPYAAARYASEPDAAKGVIVIKTKRGGGTK
jgi:hypothetical protein